MYRRTIRLEDIHLESMDYETDLEEDFATSPKRPSLDELKMIYERHCKSLGTYALRCIKNQLGNENINLKGCNIGPVSLKPASLVWKCLPKITEMNLEENGLGPAGTKHIMQAISKHDNVSRLNVSRNFIETAGIKHIAETLSKAKLNVLNELDLSCNRLGNEEIRILMDGLKQANHIESISLSDNRIGADAAQYIVIWLTGASGILKIDLSWNMLEGRGAMAICKALQLSQSIQDINFAWNGLGLEGATGVGKLIEVSQSLKQIDVSNNRIDAAGASKIADGLKENKTLEELRIGHNPFGTESVMDIVKVASGWACDNLTTLDFDGIEVEQSALLAFHILTEIRGVAITHGRISSSTGGFNLGPQMNQKPSLLLSIKADPLKVLTDSMKENGIKLSELFRSASPKEDENKQVERQQFAETIQQLKIPLTEIQIQTLVNRLDRKQTGLINYEAMKLEIKNLKAQEADVQPMSGQQQWERARKVLADMEKKEILKQQQQRAQSAQAARDAANDAKHRRMVKSAATAKAKLGGGAAGKPASAGHHRGKSGSSHHARVRLNVDRTEDIESPDTGDEIEPIIEVDDEEDEEDEDEKMGEEEDEDEDEDEEKTKKLTKRHRPPGKKAHLPPTVLQRPKTAKRPVGSAKGNAPGSAQQQKKKIKKPKKQTQQQPEKPNEDEYPRPGLPEMDSVHGVVVHAVAKFKAETTKKPRHKDTDGVESSSTNNQETTKAQPKNTTKKAENEIMTTDDESSKPKKSESDRKALTAKGQKNGGRSSSKTRTKSDKQKSEQGPASTNGHDKLSSSELSGWTNGPATTTDTDTDDDEAAAGGGGGGGVGRRRVGGRTGGGHRGTAEGSSNKKSKLRPTTARAPVRPTAPAVEVSAETLRSPRVSDLESGDEFGATAGDSTSISFSMPSSPERISRPTTARHRVGGGGNRRAEEGLGEGQTPPPPPLHRDVAALRATGGAHGSSVTSTAAGDSQSPPQDELSDEKTQPSSSPEVLRKARPVTAKRRR